MRRLWSLDAWHGIRILSSAVPRRTSFMTAIASLSVASQVASPIASLANPLQREFVLLAHRRLQTQLLPFTASNYTPEGLVSAIVEFCLARRAIGVPPGQVMIECTTLAAARLDSAGVRLV